MAKKEILLYNLENEKGKRIEQLCADLQIPFRHVPPSSYSACIGTLVGIPHVNPMNIPFSSEIFTDEMMVFFNFNGEELNEFLNRYRKEGIEKVNLKATVTPYNKHWDSSHLHRELQKEYEELKAAEKE